MEKKRKTALYLLAGYLSTFVWYEEKHPEELLDLAEACLRGIEKNPEILEYLNTNRWTGDVLLEGKNTLTKED